MFNENNKEGQKMSKGKTKKERLELWLEQSGNRMMTDERKVYFFNIWTADVFKWQELDDLIICLKAIRRSEDRYEYNRAITKLFYYINTIIPKPKD